MTEKKIIEPDGIGIMTVTGHIPSLWTKATFSHQWFCDALREAINGSDGNSIRREIVFSACFLESYIFEWARDIDIAPVDNYFPQTPRVPPPQRDPRFGRGLKEKWKEVPRELFEDGKVGVEPQLDVSRLGELVKLRNDLVHAAVSRPSRLADQENDEKPAREVLRQRNAGWALSIAVCLLSNCINS